MNFSKELREDVVIEKVNITRATYKEAEEFKNLVYADMAIGWKKFIIDMSECEFLDSTFLGTLINISKQLGMSGGHLKLADIHDDAQVLFDITRTSSIFQIYPSVDEALKSFLSY